MRRTRYSRRNAAVGSVTVRFDHTLLADPVEVLVELQVGDQPAYVSEPILVGPAAPSGTGWVGSGPMEWTVPVMRSQPLRISVRRIDDGRQIARFELSGWLDRTDPTELGRLDSGQGVRLNWRLATPYWSALTLPDQGT